MELWTLPQPLCAEGSGGGDLGRSLPPKSLHDSNAGMCLGGMRAAGPLGMGLEATGDIFMCFFFSPVMVAPAKG